MQHYHSRYPKNRLSLKQLVKQAIFIASLPLLAMSFAAISSIILIPIGMALLLKKFDSFCGIWSQSEM